MTAIIPPTNCPSCSSVLEEINNILYCRNSSCAEQQIKLIENFGSKMKIKGLGPSTIVKLGVTEIYELYYLEEEYLSVSLGSEKLAEKLYKEILKSHNAPMNLLLPSLGIPLIGTTATNKLAKTCRDIYDITETTCKDAGLGPKTSKSLLDYINENMGDLAKLPHTFKFETTTKPTSIRGVVCITGKLNSYKTKAQATAVLNDLGYEVKSTVT